MTRPDIDDPAALAQVRELLPWFAAGALAPADAQFVEQWLQRHGADQAEAQAELQAELAWLQRTALQSRELAAQHLPAADAGLAQLMSRIAAEPAAAPARAQPRPAPPAAAVNVWQRLGQWLMEALAPRPALAFGMVAVMLVQVAVIGGLITREPAGQVPLGGGASGTGSLPADMAVLSVAFSPDAREADIRAALQAALQSASASAPASAPVSTPTSTANAGGTAQIIGGPSALGLYRVAVPKAQADAALAALRALTPTIESAQREP